MRENGAELYDEYGSGRLNLRELSAIVRSADLTNDHGGPLTEATISKTWARQRQHMLTPKNVLKPGELVPGVVLRTDEILAVQPATAVIADSTSPSSQTIAGQQNVASPDIVLEPSKPRLTADEKIARVVKRTYDAHPQMPKPIEY